VRLITADTINVDPKLLSRKLSAHRIPIAHVEVETYFASSLLPVE
jgi:hypothetical protein